MYKNLPLSTLDDYFKPLSRRVDSGIYFYRISIWNKEVENFIEKVIEEISKCGIYVNKKIANPNISQLAYFDEIVGRNFVLDSKFIFQTIKKWLPRVSESVHKDLAESMTKMLLDYANQGKNNSMIFNSYAKFMCGFYYKFESVLLQVGKDSVPKILYDGIISESELKLLYIMSSTGCDIILIEKDGDSPYQAIDVSSSYSSLYQANGVAFPNDFSIDAIREKKMKKLSVPKLPMEQVKRNINTNTWISADIFKDSLKKQTERGQERAFYYNLFVGVWGAEDKNAYYNDLFKWKLKLESFGQKVFIIEDGITPPTYLEVSLVKRGNYNNRSQIIIDMIRQIQVAIPDIKKYASNAFVSVLQSEEENEIGVQKFLNQAVTILCWMNKFIPKLFQGGFSGELSTLVYYGQAKNENEVLFLRILSRMPIDVLLISPDLKEKTTIQDVFFFEKKFDISIPKEKFPKQLEEVKFGTVAYHAEQDLNTMIYQDTGIYRTKQFKKAIPIILQTTYEEIQILWNQESVYRPNFETLADRVMIPVIFSKISGVFGSIDDYWNYIAKLTGENVFEIRTFPYLKTDANNPFSSRATNYMKNGKILIDRIKQSSLYQYSFLREEMQNHIFDKMQQLIDNKTIIGTGTQGTEYTILAVLLNLDNKILRLIQKYDFTKDIPKIIVMHTTESICSIEDSIFIMYLSMLGFDVLIFVPTGYNSVERYYTNNLLMEHQVGEYFYDLSIPNLEKHKRKKGSLAEKILRRVR